MLGKRPTPVIGRLTGSLISGNWAGGVLDSSTSPRGPLEFKIVSPRSLKNYDLGGVGLGIVAALEKSAAAHHEIHTTTKAALWNRNLNRSDPIPVNSTRIGWRRRVGCEESVEMVDSFEDYTFVTCHKPGIQPFTKVYYDGSRQRTGGTTCGSTADFGRKSSSSSKGPSMFTLSSPARIGDFPVIPDPNFLNSCHLCHKKLHGKDIFMYRGEKAFCSSECRDSQILKDEQKEKCRSEASRTFEVSSSAYEKAHGQILSPGIFAI